MKAISTSNSELLEVLEANGVNIICNAEIQMTISDEDAARIPAIIDELAPAAAYDYTIEHLQTQEAMKTMYRIGWMPTESVDPAMRSNNNGHELICETLEEAEKAFSEELVATLMNPACNLGYSSSESEWRKYHTYLCLDKVTFEKDGETGADIISDIEEVKTSEYYWAE